MAREDVQIRIGAELTEIKGALAQLQAQLRQVGTEANKVGSKNTLGGLNSGLQQAKALMVGLVGSLATMAAVKGFITVADQVSTMNARLRIATRSTEEYNRAQVALFDMAQRTRAPLADTVDLYSKIALATKEAGVGSETLLGITETINQAVALSGASGQAAQAALTQLGQGLASGTLRGEELNSVLEQTPVLADAIAKGMGITRGELRKYGEEGKITAEAVIKALEAQRETIAADFKRLPVTVGQATTQIGNALRLVIGVFDEASGATGGLASVLQDLAAFLASDDFLGAVREFAAIWGGAFADIVRDTREAVRIISEGTADVAGDGRDAIDILIDAFKQLPVNVRTFARLAGVYFAEFVDRLGIAARFAKEALAAMFTDDTIAAAWDRRTAALERSATTAREMAGEILADREKALADAKKSREEAQRARAAARAARGTYGTGKPAKTTDKGGPTAADRAEAEARIIKDAVEREIKQIERLYEEASLSAAGYIRRTTELQLQAVDAEIAAKEKAVAAGGKAAVKAKADLTILQRERADIVLEGERKLEAIQRKAREDRVQLEARALEQQGEAVQATRLRVEAEFRDTLQRLQAEGDEAGVNLVRKIIDNEVLSAELNKAEQNIDLTLSRLTGGEERLRNAVQLGLIAQTTGEEQAQALREKAIAQLQVQIAAMEELAAKSSDPKAIERLEEYKARLAEIQAQQTPFIQNLRTTGEGAVGGFLSDLATGAKSLSEAWTDMVRNFVAGLARMAAEVLAKRAIFALLESFGMGGGAVGSLVGAAVKHGGGMVGGVGPTRQVSPWLFVGAPRFHNGLKPDEQAAILQTGEEVLAKGDPRNSANGGGSGGYRIVNVVDPGLVGDYMDSAAGEKSVLNVIGRNPGRIRQLIGG